MARPHRTVGPKSDKTWRNAILIAIKRDAKDGGKHIDKLARKLIDLAYEGDIQALKEIGDRLDGKPAQSVAVGQDESLGPITFKWKNE